MVHAGRIQKSARLLLVRRDTNGGRLLRVQLERGEIDRERYLIAMRGLLAQIKADVRLQPVADALDERHLLLDTKRIVAAEKQPRRRIAMSLTEKRSSQKAAKLSPPQIDALVPQVPGYELDESRTKISKEYAFPDFYETIAFVNAVAYIANQEDHHPDLAVGYGKCQVSFSTHDASGLTENDFICAAKVNALIRE